MFLLYKPYFFVSTANTIQLLHKYSNGIERILLNRSKNSKFQANMYSLIVYYEKISKPKISNVFYLVFMSDSCYKLPWFWSKGYKQEGILQFINRVYYRGQQK